MAPATKRRPITDAEYAKLTPQQRIALGLDEPAESAPVDFGGVVLPNPNHVRPLADTDSGIAPTRLPDGITFQHGNFRGPMGLDVSSPAAAELIAPAMQTVAANSEGKPVSAGTQIDFSKYEQPTKQIDFSKYEQGGSTAAAAPEKPSTAAHVKNEFLSGLGIGSDEDAKNFFEHPINTLMNSIKGQGDLAIKAKDAYKRGDYTNAVIHGLNYLVPFIGQQTDKAGEQIQQGDIAGGLARTAGAAVPIVAGSPEVQGAAKGAASAAAAGVKDAAGAVAKPAVSAVAKTATAVGDSLDPDLVGLISPRAAHALRMARKIGKVATTVDEKINPASAEPEAAPAAPQVESPAPAAAPTTPAPTTPAPGAKPTLTAAGFQEARGMGRIPTAGDAMPRTLSGESALRKVLTGQDNANLLKIAKSRGINITREAQLKPGSADSMLINKIVDDFKPEELDELGSRYLESSRFKHDFGDIGPEAWKTLSLQTYFPDLKIPQATVARTHAAILRAAADNMENAAAKPAAPAAASGGDLTTALQESVKRVKAAQGKKAAGAQ